ncbi:hypothetical protein ABZ801_21340 [Actinomadura sp. NPDC047616]|uniref:hypothetical protein n=1 Tax=Actinomadura sp. NPDC047616 TaxID=3155914 RepID=UPI003404B372
MLRGPGLSHPRAPAGDRHAAYGPLYDIHTQDTSRACTVHRPASAGDVRVLCVGIPKVDDAGIEPRRLTARQGVALGAPLPVAVLACELLDDRWSGVWAVAGVVLACWAIGYGRRHARRVRTAK